MSVSSTICIMPRADWRDEREKRIKTIKAVFCFLNQLEMVGNSRVKVQCLTAPSSSTMRGPD